MKRGHSCKYIAEFPYPTNLVVFTLLIIDQASSQELTEQEPHAVSRRAFPTEETFIPSRRTKTGNITQPPHGSPLLFRLNLFKHSTHTLINIPIISFDTTSDRESDPDFTSSEYRTLATSLSSRLQAFLYTLISID